MLSSELAHATQLLQQVVAGSGDGLFAFDREYRVRLWNPAMEGFCTRLAELALGRDVRELLVQFHGPTQVDALGTVLLGESIRLPGFSPQPACGQRRTYEVQYVPWRAGSGAVLGAIGRARDVTETKHVQQQLAETEQRFRNMADASPVLLWMSGADGFCTFFNQTWLRFTGRSMEEECGVGWAEGIYFEDFQRCMDTYMGAFDEHAVFEMEYRLRRADGEYRWVLDRGTPRYELDGCFAGYIGSCIDITERKELEGHLREAVRARDEFLSVASHELRTPVTSILLQVESLEDHLARSTREDERSRLLRSARVAVQQTTRLADLIKVLLDVSRMAAGRLDLQYEELDLASVLSDLLRRMTPIARNAGCQFELHLSSQSVVGLWDPLRIEQVITNVVSNGIKYGAGRGLEVDLSSDHDSVRLRVRDHGIGIAPEHLPRLFERFERVAPSEHYAGLGLGLWISKQIVDAHQGTIDVQSHPGEGTEFSIRLPRRPHGRSRHESVRAGARA